MFYVFSADSEVAQRWPSEKYYTCFNTAFGVELHEPEIPKSTAASARAREQFAPTLLKF